MPCSLCWQHRQVRVNEKCNVNIIKVKSFFHKHTAEVCRIKILNAFEMFTSSHIWLLQTASTKYSNRLPFWSFVFMIFKTSRTSYSKYIRPLISYSCFRNLTGASSLQLTVGRGINWQWSASRLYRKYITNTKGNQTFNVSIRMNISLSSLERSERIM